MSHRISIGPYHPALEEPYKLELTCEGEIVRDAEQGTVLMSYHWDLDGRLLSIETPTQEGRIGSIRDRCQAADWIEREIHDCFAVEFEGRDLEPLLLRPGQAPGVGLRGEDE